MLGVPMLLIAGLIRLSMGAPVLFRQPRPGLDGRLFVLLKFRTMTQDDSGTEPAADAVRITPLGRWLRSWSLDELPELINVIRGDMSLVGPRPLLPEYLPLYTTEQARRHEVRPGLTGWAQIGGRNALAWEDKFERDVWYVEHVSMGLDLRILLATMTQVVMRRGISHADHQTMPLFRGSGGAHE